MTSPLPRKLSVLIAQKRGWDYLPPLFLNNQIDDLIKLYIPLSRI
jgi:hypothetical protein